MIPVGDSTRRRRTPWVNYLFILANIAIFAYMLSLAIRIDDRSPAQVQQDFAEQRATVCYGFPAPPTPSDEFVCRWAFQPREFFDAAGGASPGGQDRLAVLITIVTSMFLHGGWLHIGGNMLFLWVFGDNVEDRLGHLPYALFYLAAGGVAALIQGAIDTSSLIPVLGASGAVAGVLGAYLIWYPRATVNVVIPFFVLIFIPLPVPAFIMIGLWFVQNLLAGYATITDAASPGGGVAWFAHIGGFVFGMLIAALVAFARIGRPPPRWR